MPRQLRDLTRRTRVPSARAADFGRDQPFQYSGGCAYSDEHCDELAGALTRKLQLRSDYLVSVEPTGRNTMNLARDLDRLMRKFSAWWGRRHRTGPDADTGWLEYVVVTAPSEANHGSHGHIVLSEVLSPAEEARLVKFASKRTPKRKKSKGEGEPRKTSRSPYELRLTFTGNTDEWLEKHPGVNEHADKVVYTLRHLQMKNADLRICDDPAPWTKRTRKRWSTRRRKATRGLPLAPTPQPKQAEPETGIVASKTASNPEPVGKKGGQRSSAVGSSRLPLESFVLRVGGWLRSGVGRVFKGVISTVWARVSSGWRMSAGAEERRHE